MSDESERAQRFKLKRREFLSSAAMPVAAALAPAALLAQERASLAPRKARSASASSARAAS